MNYHFCFWREVHGHADRLTPLPLGLSYAEAQAIIRDQVGVNNDDPGDTYWYLGSLLVAPDVREKVEYAHPIWRLHTPSGTGPRIP